MHEGRCEQVRVWATVAMLFIVSAPACAHDELAEMGHHWAIPGYLGEVHFQILAMAAAACAYVLFSYLIRAGKRRSAGR